MTNDEILYIAQNHWLYDLSNPREELAGWLVEFAQVVAAHEREECAKVCEAQQNMAVMRNPARIEVEQSTQNMMALKCAALIRARGQE